MVLPTGPGGGPPIPLPPDLENLPAGAVDALIQAQLTGDVDAYTEGIQNLELDNTDSLKAFLEAISSAITELKQIIRESNLVDYNKSIDQIRQLAIDLSFASRIAELIREHSNEPLASLDQNFRNTINQYNNDTSTANIIYVGGHNTGRANYYGRIDYINRAAATLQAHGYGHLVPSPSQYPGGNQDFPPITSTIPAFQTSLFEGIEDDPERFRNAVNSAVNWPTSNNWTGTITEGNTKKTYLNGVTAAIRAAYDSDEDLRDAMNLVPGLGAPPTSSLGTITPVTTLFDTPIIFGITLSQIWIGAAQDGVLFVTVSYLESIVATLYEGVATIEQLLQLLVGLNEDLVVQGESNRVAFHSESLADEQETVLPGTEENTSAPATGAGSAAFSVSALGDNANGELLLSTSLLTEILVQLGLNVPPEAAQALIGDRLNTLNSQILLALVPAAGLLAANSEAVAPTDEAVRLATIIAQLQAVATINSSGESSASAALVAGQILGPDATPEDLEALQSLIELLQKLQALVASLLTLSAFIQDVGPVRELITTIADRVAQQPEQPIERPEQPEQSVEQPRQVAEDLNRPNVQPDPDFSPEFRDTSPEIDINTGLPREIDIDISTGLPREEFDPVTGLPLREIDQATGLPKNRDIDPATGLERPSDADRAREVARTESRDDVRPERRIDPEIERAVDNIANAAADQLPENERDNLRQALREALRNIFLGGDLFPVVPVRIAEAFSEARAVEGARTKKVEVEDDVGIVPSIDDVYERDLPTTAPPLVDQMYDYFDIPHLGPLQDRKELVEQIFRELFSENIDLDTILTGMLDPGESFWKYGWGPYYGDTQYGGGAEGYRAVNPV